MLDAGWAISGLPTIWQYRFLTEADCERPAHGAFVVRRQTGLRAGFRKSRSAGAPITDLDIAHREKFIEMSTHKKPSRQEAINSLIDETLELKETARYSLDPTDADVQQAYQNVADNMGVDAQKLTRILANGGASADTLKLNFDATQGWHSAQPLAKIATARNWLSGKWRDGEELVISPILRRRARRKM